MKYAVLIPLGAADEPQPSLTDATPLEAAVTPNLSTTASVGRIASVQTVEGDAAHGLEGLVGLLDAGGGRGLRLAPRVSEGSLAAVRLPNVTGAWIYSLGWMATQDGSGEASAADTAVVAEWDESTLTDAESDLMWNDIRAAWAAAEPELAARVRVERGLDRWVLVDSTAEHDHTEVRTQAPWTVIGESWRKVEPDEGDVDATWVLRRFMHVGAEVLSTHDVNISRMERGLPLVTMPWPYGSGQTPAWATFESRFKLRGAMITDHPLAAAIAGSMGWSVFETPSVAGVERVLGEVAVDTLGVVDVVCVCSQRALAATKVGDVAGKQRAIEAFDSGIVGPVAARLKDFGDPEADAEARGWRLLILPDAVWPLGSQEPTADAVPALMAGAWIRAVVQRRFIERSAEEADLRITKPGDLMEFFLLGGLAKAKAVGRRKEESGTLWDLEP